MKKKVGLCIIVLVLAPILAIVIPWDKISIKNLLGAQKEFTSLRVYSLAGNMKVYVDGEEKGEVSSDISYLEVFPLEIGHHIVRLERISTSDGFYNSFEKRIWFENGFDTVISYELGPSVQSSSGWILYAKKNPRDKDKTNLQFVCLEADCELFANDENYEQDEVYGLLLDNQYNMKATADGYQDLEFTILPEEEEARKKLAGYDLFLEVNLYKMPI